MPDGAEVPGQREERRETELTLVPFVGGDSDVGLGGGYIASLAEVGPGYSPFRWRLESATTITFKREDDSLQLPFTDSYLLLVLPHVIKNRLRVSFRLSYTREATLKYYGLGNASRIPPDREPQDDYFEHLRVHPTLRVRAESRLAPALLLTWGIAYTHNWLEVPPGTRLAEDMLSGTERERRLLGTDTEHGVLEYSLGVGLDTRDNEVNTHSGHYYTIRADAAPGGVSELPYRWARLNAATRWYVPLVPRRLTLAARVVTDFLLGRPPLYELPRYDDTSAIGGVKGVRGVPAQRYYGKIKLFGNVELRTELFDVSIMGKRHSFGVTGFFDAGRLWADYRKDSSLDGEGIGLKYGAGGGLRISAGESFVLRLDVAASPDANPVGAYLASGHMF